MARPAKSPAKADRPYHHGNLRRALLDEALATIRTRGVESLTLREIGARVGVSRTALYRHFADKRALLAAVSTEGFRSLRQQLDAAWAGGGRTRAGLDAMGRAYVRFAVANPSHYRVMFGGFVDPDASDQELDEEARGAFMALVDALAALQDDGLLRREDATTMAQFVWAVVHGVARLAIDGQLHDMSGASPADPHEAIDRLLAYALERLHTGIEAPAAPQRGH